MNYYEHHLGDYDGATAHLSWLEDCAYRRLICLYYRTEAPIPADLKQACRLLRATSKQERDAVEQVLGEFFTLEADGWHHDRCDAEVARYRERSQKARESVSKRWAKRDANAVPTAYESDTNVLPTNNEGNTPRARPQTPDTRHTPSDEGVARKRAPAPACPDDVDAQVWADWLRLRKDKRATVTPTVIDGARGEAAKAGMSLEAFLRVWCRRGTQGLEAAWLKPDERQQHTGETAFQRSRRERVEEMTGGLLSTRPKQHAEVIDVTAKLAR